ncbi:MAG: CBS domain-containing protein, partial [Desulfobacteraceae bacterium]
AFPVVDDDNKLLGILSVRDLLRAFINVLGIGEPGTLLCVLVEERVGQLKKLWISLPKRIFRAVVCWLPAIGKKIKGRSLFIFYP